MFKLFKATLSEPQLLVNSISTIAELIDEGLFKISKDGISLVAADRAMVAVVNFNLSSAAFQNYDLDEEQTIGLNISNLLSVLKRATGSDKISLGLNAKKLEILIEGSSKRKFTVPLLDLSQEEVPPIDQLEFTVSAEVKPEVLQSGVDDAEIISDSVVFEISSNGFLMKAEGDVSKAELELEKGNKALINIQTESNAKSRYPLDYLKKMMKAAKIADAVAIKFGQDYPMKLSFKCGDKCSLQFILAPRVSENE
ncbi:MAG: proliferating cell nuclear antigen (pcna) [Candidatus Aenigmarchaeota archaeon]|nr:proliferating cell nuclear antigen (pcna) [Candidatus Aenigmarchaeota archaeon]